MWVRRIVFGAEIKTFGLEEREIREVLNKVVDGEWDIEDIKNGRNGCIEVQLEFRPRGQYCGSIKPIEERATDLFKLMQSELERYATLKPYLRIYNRCNSHNGSEAREIMRKVGIQVIS